MTPDHVSTTAVFTRAVDIRGAAADSTENRFGKIVRLVREANEIAGRMASQR